MASTGKKKSGGGRKHGRNAIWCAAYRARGQREINKAVKIAHHLRAHPEDLAGLKTFQALPILAQKKTGYQPE